MVDGSKQEESEVDNPEGRSNDLGRHSSDTVQTYLISSFLAEAFGD